MLFGLWSPRNSQFSYKCPWERSKNVLNPDPWVQAFNIPWDKWEVSVKPNCCILKYNRCLKGKYLCDWVSERISLFFLMKHLFYLKELTYYGYQTFGIWQTFSWKQRKRDASNKILTVSICCQWYIIWALKEKTEPWEIFICLRLFWWDWWCY